MSFEATLKSVTNFSDISPDVKSHLSKVYSTLAVTTAVAVGGCFFSMNYEFNGILPLVLMVVSTMYVLFSKQNKNDEKRFIALFASGFFMGNCVTPLVEASLQIDESIVMSAFIGATSIFLCFSLAALKAQRRSYLFLGGILSSYMMFMLLINLGRMMFGIHTRLPGELFIGLIVFSLFVIYDTQIIVERASNGDYDIPTHALMLFMDLADIFIKLLRLLSEKKGKEKKNNSR